MKTILLNRTFMNIVAAVRDGDIYYVSAEEAQQLRTLLTVFAVLAIIGAVLVAATVIAFVVKRHKLKNEVKGGGKQNDEVI